MTDAIQKEIEAKGLTAPRITPDDIKANIVSEHYFTAADGVLGRKIYGSAVDMLTKGSARTEIGLEPEPLRLLTFCVLVLANGFTVTGESACASPENFNAEIGRKIARENAVNKVWPLMGYELRTQLYTRASFGSGDGLAQPQQRLTEADAAADLAGEPRPVAESN